ncbi:hypothetical protein J4438_01285 [Candidatus Woesearchaeota archaeon]|nr:hypothetical protein [Candidatus Woesearchaeota archaeon]
MKKQFSWGKLNFSIAITLAILLSLSSLIGGTFVTLPIWTFLLVILGLITGFIYKIKEVSILLLISITLVIIGGSSLTIIPYIGSMLRNIISYFTYFITTVALVVALKKSYEILK